MMPLILFSTLEHEFVIGSALRSFGLLRLFRIIHLFFRTISIFEGSKIMYILIFAFSSIMFGAYAEYVVEFAAPESKISSFGDALWWAPVTVTTVGFGDIYPVTSEGKVIASFLMIIGIMILGLFISTLGSSFVESWIEKKERKNTKARTSTGKEKSITEGNTLPSVEEDTKSLVKNRIDVLESLKEEEFKILISMLKTLYYKRENIG
jgi:voltage-gated potassium channel